MGGFTTNMKGPDAVSRLNQLDDRVAGTLVVAYAGAIDFDICQVQRTRDLILAGPATINFVGVVNGVTLALGDAGLLAYDGFMFMLRVKQDATGTRLITWGTGSRFGTDITGIVLTTTPSKGDRIGLQYCHADGKMDIIGYSRGY